MNYLSLSYYFLNIVLFVILGILSLVFLNEIKKDIKEECKVDSILSLENRSTQHIKDSSKSYIIVSTNPFQRIKIEIYFIG